MQTYVVVYRTIFYSGHCGIHLNAVALRRSSWFFFFGRTWPPWNATIQQVQQAECAIFIRLLVRFSEPTCIEMDSGFSSYICTSIGSDDTDWVRRSARSLLLWGLWGTTERRDRIGSIVQLDYTGRSDAIRSDRQQYRPVRRIQLYRSRGWWFSQLLHNLYQTI